MRSGLPHAHYGLISLLDCITKPKRMGAQLLCDCSPTPHASPCLACGGNFGFSQFFHTVQVIIFLSQEKTTEVSRGWTSPQSLNS